VCLRWRSAPSPSKLNFDTSRRQLNAQATPVPGVCGRGVRRRLLGTQRILFDVRLESAFGGKAEVGLRGVRAAFDPNSDMKNM